MNYLAHIFLSGEDKEIQIGNFMGDAVKGKKYNDFPIQIRKGLLLHREIDSFTDTNDFVKKSKRRLNDRCGHYTGVIIDIFYDYFLAKNWKLFSTIDMNDFIDNFYKTLKSNMDKLHPETQDLANKIITNNWFYNYTTLQGIEKVLIRMEKQIIHDIPLHLSIDDLRKNEEQLEEDFLSFFPELQIHVKQKLNYLNNKYNAKIQ